MKAEHSGLVEGEGQLAIRGAEHVRGLAGGVGKVAVS